jgi:RNA polymerase sigma-70 factor, ECF subfamily
MITESAIEISAVTQLSDEEVVGRVLAGDIALFEVIMRRYNPRLYRVARAILRDDAEAEDVMQDAYVRAHQHLRQFAGRAKFSTWLTRIAVHEALARAKKRNRIEEFDAMTAPLQDDLQSRQPQSPTPEQQLANQQLGTLLEHAIASLPDNYRTVFVLREVEELSTLEAAACLELSEENVKVRLHRAKALLRKELLARAGSTAPSVMPFHLSRCDRVVENVFARIRDCQI